MANKIEPVSAINIELLFGFDRTGLITRVYRTSWDSISRTLSPVELKNEGLPERGEFLIIYYAANICGFGVVFTVVNNTRFKMGVIHQIEFLLFCLYE